MMPTASQEAVALGPVSKESTSKKLVQEPVRFVFHSLGISLAGVLAFLLPNDLAGLAAISLVVTCLIGESLRASERFLNWPWWTILGPLTRITHRVDVRENEVGTRTATLDFSVGLYIAWGTCPLWAVAAACLVTAWADPLARVVGKRWGSIKWPGSKKTLEGSGTCFFVTTLICTFVLAGQGVQGPVVLAVSIIAGVMTTLAELIPQWPKKPRPGDILTPADNFWLVIVAAATLTICSRLML